MVIIKRTILSITKKSIDVWSEVTESLEGKFCPVSGTKGLIVKKITMRNHVQEKYWDIISDTNYFFCPNKKCSIIYFNNEESYYFLSENVKTRVSHKLGKEPRPICYCLNVLEHRILDEILTTKRAETLDDIKKYTGARTGRLCHINNPSGRCCGPQVNEVIAKGLELLNSDKTTQEAVLENIHSGCEYCQHDVDYLEPSISIVAETCKTCKIDWEKPELTQE